MTIEEKPSSNDDASHETSASEAGADEAACEAGVDVPNNADQPWWATDPAIIALRDEVDRWLDSAQQDPVPDDDFTAIHSDIISGSCRRELRRAREDLVRARARYANAVKAARRVGYSWGEIGRLLEVPRQLLHRRFRHEVD